MVFIARSNVLKRPDTDGKIIRANDFWSFCDAQQALSDANNEKIQIIAESRLVFEEEKKRGYREGVELAKLEQSANMIAIVSQTVDYFSKVEAQMVELVMESVQKIINDFDDREKVIKVVRNSLTLVRNQKYITIVVHPSQSNSVSEGINAIKSSFPSIEKIDIAIDSQLNSDACIIESEIGRVEASMAGQIEALRSTFERVFGASENNQNGQTMLACGEDDARVHINVNQEHACEP